MAIQFQPLSAGSGVVKIQSIEAGIKPVPTIGIVEKLIFNTTLLPNQLDNAIKNANLNYVNFDGMPMYPIFVNEENEIGIIIVDYGTVLGNGDTAYVIMEYGSNSIIYCSSMIASFTQIDGWNFALFEQLGGGNEFPVNMEANSSFQGLPVGSQNDFIIDIINCGGSEPYYKELNGTYEPLKLKVSEEGEVDLTTYMDDKKMPISLDVKTTNGTIDITSNGEYDVTKYKNANVNFTINLQSKSVTPTTSAQTITYDDGYDGLRQITVRKVDYNIDKNITSSNIKQGVAILGMMGSYEGEGIDYTINSNVTIIPDYMYRYLDMLRSINLNKVTSIGKYAFYGNDKLKKLTITSTLREIKEQAFKRYSYSLTSIEELWIQDFYNYLNIDIADGPFVTTKLYIDNVETNILTIPDGWQTLKQYVCRPFSTKMVEIHIPSTLSTIKKGNLTKGCSVDNGKLYIDSLDHLCNLELEIETDRYDADKSLLANRSLYINNQLVEDIVIPTTYTEISPLLFSYSFIKSFNGQSLTIIRQNQFRECNNLSNISLPNVEKIEGYAFNKCVNLETISMPKATIVGSGAFSSCSKLSNISLPNVKTIGVEAFTNCRFEYFDFSNVESIMETSFQLCSNLKEAIMPKVTSLSTYCLSLCESLEKVDLGVCTSIGEASIAANQNLRTLIIRTPNQVCSIFYATNDTDRNSLMGTPLEDGEGYVYVPDDLVTSYKADIGWQTNLLNYNTQIRPLSEYVG